MSSKKLGHDGFAIWQNEILGKLPAKPGAFPEKLECSVILEIPNTIVCLGGVLQINRTFLRVSNFAEGNLTKVGDLVSQDHSEFVRQLSLFSGYNVKGKDWMAFFKAVDLQCKTDSKKCLNSEEQEIFKKIIQPAHKRDPKFILLAIPVESSNRNLSFDIFSHEILHAAFYLGEKYRKKSEEFWESLPSDAQGRIKEELKKEYDLSSKDLLIDEFQAFILMKRTVPTHFKLADDADTYGKSLREKVSGFFSSILNLDRGSAFNSFQISCRSKLSGTTGIQLCRNIERRLFSGNEPIQETSPQRVQTPALPTDAKTRFEIFHNPRYLPVYGYCYFVFKGWVNPKKMNPNQFAFNASGFAVTKNELEGYESWRNTSAGGECSKEVVKVTGFQPYPLEREVRERDGYVALNPLGAIQGKVNLPVILTEVGLAMNHERIHILQSKCTPLEEWGQAEWLGLTPEKKKRFAKLYPTYDWKNLKIAGREYVAFQYENNPNQVVKKSKKCWQ